MYVPPLLVLAAGRALGRSGRDAFLQVVAAALGGIAVLCDGDALQLQLASNLFASFAASIAGRIG
jgi:hypothetical protein